MYKNLPRRTVLGTLALCAAGYSGRLASAPVQPSATKAPLRLPLRAAFVYVSPVGNAGWSYQHDLGRLAMERKLGGRVQSTVVESVPEGPDAERVFRDLAIRGHHLVFATSFGYQDAALRVAQEHTGVVFEHAGGFKRAPNFNTYNARFYEGRYLAGMLAGRMSRNGVAGYVAGFPIPEVIQGINAFALGMRAADPRARVRVIWLNAWFDPARERDAAQALLNQGADVLTYHCGSTAVPQLAEERGAMLLGYQSDLRHIAPRAQLTSVVHEWGGYYTRVAESVIAGTWSPEPFWGGLRQRVVRLAPFSDRVPQPLRFQLQEVERALAAGRVKPFSGRLVDNAGGLRQDAGSMRDEDIASMNFLIDGVVGSLPTR